MTKLNFSDQPKKIFFSSDSSLFFKDDNLTVFPIKVDNDLGQSCYSFICQPKQGNMTFIPAKANAIKGLEKKFFRNLTAGETVTLNDGTKVTPEDVCEPPAQA